MIDRIGPATPSRAELCAEIREQLGSLGSSLRVVATDVLGAEARIDCVAADPDGRVHVVLISTEPDDLAQVALGLAQRAWVEARLADWVQIAPQQGLQPEAPVRAILIAPRFSSTVEAAVRAAGAEAFDLVRFRWLEEGGTTRAVLEAESLAGQAAGLPSAAAPPPASRFRTGLVDADLAVSSEEKRQLGPPRG